MTIRWETIKPIRPNRLDASGDVLGRAVAGSQQLRAFLKAAASANEPVRLLVNDPHRATQSRPALTAIRELTGRLGIQPRFIALVATGTHTFGQVERRAFEEATFGGELSIGHAERMCTALVNETADLAAANRKYVMRITGDNDEGKAELDDVIDPESRYPVITTTSQPMSTGATVC